MSFDGMTISSLRSLHQQIAIGCENQQEDFEQQIRLNDRRDVSTCAESQRQKRLRSSGRCCTTAANRNEQDADHADRNQLAATVGSVQWEDNIKVLDLFLINEIDREMWRFRADNQLNRVVVNKSFQSRHSGRLIGPA